jgi:hypothetical protein
MQREAEAREIKSEPNWYRLNLPSPGRQEDNQLDPVEQLEELTSGNEQYRPQVVDGFVEPLEAWGWRINHRMKCQMNMLMAIEHIYEQWKPEAGE